LILSYLSGQFSPCGKLLAGMFNSQRTYFFNQSSLFR
jgi:hypothetical protein